MGDSVSWFSRLFGGSQKAISSPHDLMAEIARGQATQSGVDMNAEKALRIATVLACARVVANGIAQVPWKLYQTDGEGRMEAQQHRLYDVIHRKPNEWQTSYEFRQTIALHLTLLGNAFVHKQLVGQNREIRGLEPIEPQRVRIDRSSGGVLSYRVRADDGAEMVLSADQVWHIRGPSWNGWHGLEPVNQAAEALGLAKAAEQSQASFHKGGAKVSGVLSMDGTIGADQFGTLSAWLARHSEGGDLAGRPLILDNGAKWQSMQMTGVDAQHLETRKHQVDEMCRALGVFPQMIGHAGDQAPTFASAEAFFTAHVVHTLSPWYECIEQSADCSLLSDAERARGYYTKFNPNGLMRGSAKDRAEYFAKALGSGGHPGWMTANEVRGREEMPPLEGGEVLPTGASEANADGV